MSLGAVTLSITYNVPFDTGLDLSLASFTRSLQRRVYLHGGKTLNMRREK